MTLGNFAGANITITNFDVKSGKDAVILETIAGLRQVLMGKTTWDKFTAASRYLKETQTVVNRSTAIPRMDFNLSLDDAISEFNKLGSIYEKGDLGILGKTYKPFSTIYPDYKFLP
jgi:dihydrofolate reductase